ncbi:hypothetical protein SAMD00019534_093540, partial [Acytostelium subglobosum LB1]|uniref:hypothetical protein n=1 Tax=Acytostelium subglobosum LB1 TaxID=1410327 RepID=UPI000644C979
SITTTMSSENLPPDVIKRILKELKDISSNPMEGVTMMPCDQDISNIEAYITGPSGTPYEGGYFKARLTLCSDFPRVPPKANFLTKIFHPNVSKKGEICVNTLKRDWTDDLGIKHILLTIKCLLIVPNAESSLNEDASRLMLDNYDDYFKHAKMFTSIHAPKPASIVEPSSTATPATGSTDESSTTPAAASTTSNITTSSPVKKKPVDTRPEAKGQVKKSLKRL